MVEKFVDDKYIVTVGEIKFSGNVSISKEELDKAAEMSPSITDMVMGEISATLDRRTDDAFYEWMCEVDTPEEPWKHPVNVLHNTSNGKFHIEFIDAWFEQLDRVERFRDKLGIETQEEWDSVERQIELQIMLHWEDKRVWLWNERSRSWYNDEEITLLWSLGTWGLRPLLILT